VASRSWGCNRNLFSVLDRILIIGLCLTLAGCSARTASVVPAGSPSTDSYAIGWTQIGVASWYGEPFHGRLTASGEVYDMDLMTAAHQALPFGTRIRVDNRDNNRSIELVVNDRGPFVKNRILDVSRSGARALGMIGPGTAQVLITILKPGGDLVSVRGGCVVVQVASFRDPDAAESRRVETERAGFASHVEHNDGWYRVVAGPYREVNEARRAANTLDGFVRRCSE
jgi:rare lipoprotein A